MLIHTFHSHTYNHACQRTYCDLQTRFLVTQTLIHTFHSHTYNHARQCTPIYAILFLSLLFSLSLFVFHTRTPTRTPTLTRTNANIDTRARARTHTHTHTHTHTPTLSVTQTFSLYLTRSLSHTRTCACMQAGLHVLKSKSNSCRCSGQPRHGWQERLPGHSSPPSLGRCGGKSGLPRATACWPSGRQLPDQLSRAWTP